MEIRKKEKSMGKLIGSYINSNSTENLIGSYVNGNYDVSIYNDGTKIRENDLDHFSPEFPENIDIKITDYCDAGCLYCHENSTKQGKHADLDWSSSNWNFFHSLRPYTELAIGGGNPLDHPELLTLLRFLKAKKIVANLTVNQIHFERDYVKILEILDEGLIYGLGISMVKGTEKFANLVSLHPNAVVHVINGVVTTKALEPLFDKNLKILILGYKYLRRGMVYFSREVMEQQHRLHYDLPYILNKFKVVSFDNLALEQLEVRRLVSDDYWNQFYMGDDGKFTMYIDLVRGEFSKSSTCDERYPIQNNIVDMFNVAKRL
jgi:hypothetical protein